MDGKTLIESTQGTPACVSVGNVEKIVSWGWKIVPLPDDVLELFAVQAGDQTGANWAGSP